MRCRVLIWLSLCAGAFAPSSVSAGDLPTTAPLPLDRMTPTLRTKVRLVVDKPTLRVTGPTETFVCDPAIYAWFLEHPDRAVAAWRLLGAKVVDIVDRGDGRFGWSDPADGSDVVWETAYRDEFQRIWIAEGKVKPGPLLAMVPFQAVVVLHHSCGPNEAGKTAVRHHAEFVLHTDSRGAAAVAKLLGASGTKLAEQYVGQVEMFFSALPWYIDQHPERARELLAAAPTSGSPRPQRRPEGGR